jgi:probable F420-dependent oxidoreductase
MKIGLGIPQTGRFADGGAARTVAVAAEAHGFASLWAFDRLLAPVEPRSAYPGTPDGALPSEQRHVLDPLVTLTLAAAVTDRIRVGTDVIVAPWYPPALLARSLATLDHVSRGRLTVGLGMGWSADEYDAAGVPMSDRGRRIEEIIDVLTTIWIDDVVSIRTTREFIAPSVVGVKPTQKPRPPLLLATFNPAGLDRIARMADGWLPVGMPLDMIEMMWAGVLRRAAEYGRDTSDMQLVVRAETKIGEIALGSDRPPFSGNWQQVVGDIERAQEIGATELILDMQSTARSTDELIDTAIELTADHLALTSAGS